MKEERKRKMRRKNKWKEIKRKKVTTENYIDRKKKIENRYTRKESRKNDKLEKNTR